MAQPQPLPLSLILLSLTLCTSLPLTLGQFSPNPPTNALVAPITKETTTSLYTIALNTPKQFLIDLAGPIIWTHCNDPGFVQCTAPICNEAVSVAPRQCPPAQGTSPPFTRPIPCPCLTTGVNPITKACFSGDQILISATLNATNGKNPTSLVSASLVNLCAPQSALYGLPPGVVGVAGFGRTTLISLPSWLAWDLLFYNQFALCLPSTTAAPGVAFFGNKPFYLLPPYLPEITNFLSYTNLLKSPNMTDTAYYLNVKGVAVNGKSVSFDSRVLGIDRLGNGGVMLSTTIPYTAMRRNIYRSFLKAFRNATTGIKQMPKVKPFDLCFDTGALGSTRVGYGVPPIDIMLKDGKNWTVWGANSLKQVAPTTACLAFVDGGKNAPAAITVGGFQMEDSFLLFDIPKLTLGFISTLRAIQTTCSNFNFTSGI